MAGRYGADGVTAVATVTVDYDKMVTESKQYQPRDDDADGGVVSHFEENYSLNGSVPAQGIVGEENNTDSPPTYPNEDGDGETSATDYSKNIDYDVSYVLTQLEKGEPVLERASVAVVVDDSAFNTEVEETLVDLISKAVNISRDNIRVTNLNFSTQDDVDGQQPQMELSRKQLLLLALLVLLLIFVVTILVVFFVHRARKRRQKQEEELEAAELQRQQELDREIEEHKRMLQNEARASATPKEDAITEEVREFANSNPEITAALLRSLLREEK